MKKFLLSPAAMALGTIAGYLAGDIKTAIGVLLIMWGANITARALIQMKAREKSNDETGGIGY